MAWRVAQSLETLREQINSLWPIRSIAADGGIGDPAHVSRTSDHNQWVKDGKMGVVTARDFTHDPLHGLDSEGLAESLRASKDSRIKYCISNRKIFSGAAGPAPWTWREYPVPPHSNPHNHHVHVSVMAEKAKYDSTKPWKVGKHKVDPAIDIKPVPPKLQAGTSGLDVMLLQTLLNKNGANPLLKADGDFGSKTKLAVIAFQKSRGLAPDGICGPYVWSALKGE